jgi:hypothetical protein
LGPTTGSERAYHWSAAALGRGVCSAQGVNEGEAGRSAAVRDTDRGVGARQPRLRGGETVRRALVRRLRGGERSCGSAAGEVW